MKTFKGDDSDRNIPASLFEKRDISAVRIYVPSSTVGRFYIDYEVEIGFNKDSKYIKDYFTSLHNTGGSDVVQNWATLDVKYHDSGERVSISGESTIPGELGTLISNKDKEEYGEVMYHDDATWNIVDYQKNATATKRPSYFGGVS